jgi:hypothetical protein
MKLFDRFRAWLLQGIAPAPVVASEREPMKISLLALAEARSTGGEPLKPWTLPAPIGPGAAANIAMDEMNPEVARIYAEQMAGAFSEGLGFLGYPYLAELTQRSEYRHIAETYALECTRKWVKITGDNEDRVDELEKALARLKVRDVFREAVEHDAFFGRAQILIDMGDRPMDKEWSRPLMLRKEKVKKGGLKRFRTIEPLWSYPGPYDASNPLAPDFYKPRSWQVQTMNVHATRLLTIVGREMPDLLKPAYSFGGLSLSQMAKPYVDNWLRTRQSVADLVHSFSTMVLQTDMAAVLQGHGAESLIARAELFNRSRDNRGLMLVDKDREALSNVSTPLGTLDKLQAQAQEQIASVTGIPLVVLLGVTPSGLNASSDGEIKTFYARVHGYQERVLREPLETVLKLVQLSEFGEIDESIAFEFVDLWELDEVAAAGIRKSDADVDVAFVNAGMVSPEEARERLSNDERSSYNGVDLSGPAPEPPAETDEEDAAALAAGPGDDDDEDGQAADGWITTENGSRLKLDNDGVVIGGAGGKLNGRKLSGAASKAAEPDYSSHPQYGQYRAALADTRDKRDRLNKLKIALSAVPESERAKATEGIAGGANQAHPYNRAAKELGFHPLSMAEIDAQLAQQDKNEQDVEAYWRRVTGQAADDAPTFREQDHPRRKDGKFGSGGGGGGSGSGGKEKAKEEPSKPASASSAGGEWSKGVDPKIAEALGEKGVNRLRELSDDKNSTEDQIAEVMKPLEALQQDITPTLAHGQKPDKAFWAKRRYTVDKGAPGAAKFKETKAYLVDFAKQYASADGGVGMKYEKRARILLGPPAAGKSTSAEEIARQSGYAIADSDDAKKVIPEFDGGVGASAVHEESGFLGGEALLDLLKEGANVILPVVGAKPGSIRDRIAMLKEAGYEVTVDLVDVNRHEAARRRAKRTLRSGRIIASSYALSIGDGPQNTYETLKSEYPDVGFGRIDGNGPPKSERYIEAIKHPDASEGKSLF